MHFIPFQIAFALEPITAYKEGGWLGVAVLLFLLNFMQNYGLKKSNETLVEAVKQSNLATVNSNTTLATNLTEMAKTLADGQEKLTTGLTDVIKNQEILATNQMNLTHSNSEVVRELITIIRMGEHA